MDRWRKRVSKMYAWCERHAQSLKSSEPDKDHNGNNGFANRKQNSFESDRNRYYVHIQSNTHEPSICISHFISWLVKCGAVDMGTFSFCRCSSFVWLWSLVASPSFMYLRSRWCRTNSLGRTGRLEWEDVQVVKLDLLKCQDASALLEKRRKQQGVRIQNIGSQWSDGHFTDKRSIDCIRPTRTARIFVGPFGGAVETAKVWSTRSRQVRTSLGWCRREMQAQKTLANWFIAKKSRPLQLQDALHPLYSHWKQLEKISKWEQTKLFALRKAENNGSKQKELPWHFAELLVAFQHSVNKVVICPRRVSQTSDVFFSSFAVDMTNSVCTRACWTSCSSLLQNRLLVFPVARMRVFKSSGWVYRSCVSVQTTAWLWRCSFFKAYTLVLETWSLQTCHVCLLTVVRRFANAWFHTFLPLTVALPSVAYYLFPPCGSGLTDQLQYVDVKMIGTTLHTYIYIYNMIYIYIHT